MAIWSGLDAGVLLDAQAKTAYRRRLTEVDEDIEEAETLGDGERAAQAQGERDFLVRELARAVGLGGRDRRAGSTSERARASVTRAVRQAITRISMPFNGLASFHTCRLGFPVGPQPDFAQRTKRASV